MPVSKSYNQPCPVCPHCNRRKEDWYWCGITDGMEDEQESEETCEKCGTVYRLRMRITYAFDSWEPKPVYEYPGMYDDYGYLPDDKEED